jgi:hypothetical protein
MPHPHERMRSRLLANGIELLEATLDRHVYERHIHDMHAIGVTLGGVQRFWCSGATRDSLAGNVISIHPGEAHDGRSGTEGAYCYRMMYVPVETIRELAQDAGTPLSVARQPVIDDPALGRLLNDAWRALDRGEHTLAADELFGAAVIGLHVRHGGLRLRREEQRDVPMLERVRDYLHAHLDANVRVHELATITSICAWKRRSGACCAASRSPSSPPTSASPTRAISTGASRARSG